MKRPPREGEGRPTIYGDKVITATKKYLVEYMRFGDVIPSIAGLACYLDVSRSTIYDWASQEDKQEFSHILANILSNQERILINKGLSGEFNSNITKLALGKHGYTDKADVTSGGKVIPIYGGLSGNNSDEKDIQTPKED